MPGNKYARNLQNLIFNIIILGINVCLTTTDDNQSDNFEEDLTGFTKPVTLVTVDIDNNFKIIIKI